jgi:Tfp pilus assembly protein PilX
MTTARTMLRARRAQRGATLVVVLIMLVILTLFALAAINLSSSNLKVIGNMQARKAAEAAALYAVEDTLSSMGWFGANYTTVRNVTAPNGLTAQVQARSCKYALAAEGYSAVQPIVPEDTVWDFKVEVTDPVTNARAAVWQGTKIRMLAGGCV